MSIQTSSDFEAHFLFLRDSAIEVTSVAPSVDILLGVDSISFSFSFKSSVILVFLTASLLFDVGTSLSFVALLLLDSSATVAVSTGTGTTGFGLGTGLSKITVFAVGCNLSVDSDDVTASCLHANDEG